MAFSCQRTGILVVRARIFEWYFFTTNTWVYLHHWHSLRGVHLDSSSKAEDNTSEQTALSCSHSKTHKNELGTACPLAQIVQWSTFLSFNGIHSLHLFLVYFAPSVPFQTQQSCAIPSFVKSPCCQSLVTMSSSNWSYLSEW
jgi:hypothetical protein